MTNPVIEFVAGMKKINRRKEIGKRKIIFCFLLIALYNLFQEFFDRMEEKQHFILFSSLDFSHFSVFISYKETFSFLIDRIYKYV